MTSDRIGKIIRLLTSEAAGKDDPDALLTELLSRKPKMPTVQKPEAIAIEPEKTEEETAAEHEELMKSLREIADKPESAPGTKSEPATKPPMIPGAPIRTRTQPQREMFPEPGAYEEVTEIAPSKAEFLTCPTCGTKNSHYARTAFRLDRRTECEICPKLYQKILRAIEENSLPVNDTDAKVRESAKNEAAKLSARGRYTPSIMKQVFETKGVTDISKVPVETQQPGLRQKVDYDLMFNLNVEKDDKGRVKRDARGFPIPLKRPKYITTYDLARQLRWNPDHLVSELENKGFDPIPIGGSEYDLPEREPRETDQSPNAQKLRTLEIMLRKMTRPAGISITDDLKELEDDLKKAKTKLQEATAANKFHEMADLVTAIKRITSQIQEIKTLRSPKGQALRPELEKEISRLRQLVKEEQGRKPKIQRFKTSWLNVWNMDKIADVIKERRQEVENVIKPAERAKYFGDKMRRYEWLRDKSEEDASKLEGALRFIMKELVPEEKKQLGTLNRLRKDNTTGSNRRNLEKLHGRKLDIIEEQARKISKAKEKASAASAKAEEYALRFIKNTEELGFHWEDTEPGAGRSKMADALLRELEDMSGQESEPHLEPDEEVSEASDFPTFPKPPPSFMPSSGLLRPEEGEQLSMFGPEGKKKILPESGVHMLGRGPEDPERESETSEELEMQEPEPFVGPPTPKPAKTEVPREKLPAALRFGTDRGTYTYILQINDLENEVTSPSKAPVLHRKQFGEGVAQMHRRLLGVRLEEGPDAIYVRTKKELPNIETKLKSLLPKMVSDHNLVNAYVALTVNFLPMKVDRAAGAKRHTRKYSFTVSDGKPEWLGTSEVKRSLLNDHPEIKLMLQQGLIGLKDIVELDGKLYERSYLEGPGGRSREEKSRKSTLQKLFTPEAEKTRAATREERLKKNIKRIMNSKGGEKFIEDLKSRLDNGEISYDEFWAIAYAKSDQLKEKIKQEEEEEGGEYIPSIRTIPSGKGKDESDPEMERCPYKGCGALIPKGSSSCWQCKSPIGSDTRILKVVKSIIPKDIDSDEIDPSTGEKRKVKKRIFITRHSLVTINLGKGGNPASAKCEELPTIETSEGPSEPRWSKVWKELSDLIASIMDDPGKPQELKERVLKNKRKLYEALLSKKVEKGELTEEQAENPWMPAKAVGAPGGTCKGCNSIESGPFDADRLKSVCPAIAEAIKSLKMPRAYVFPYEAKRAVTEKELSKGMDKPFKGTERSRMLPIPADDGSRKARMEKAFRLLIS